MAGALSPTMMLRDFENGYKGLTRAEAIAAWTELKGLDVPTDYASWVKARAKRKRKTR